MSNALHMMSARDLASGFGTRRFSPVEVTQAVLDRIGELDKTYNAFCVIDGESALEAARQSERRWHEERPLSPIDGVPTTVKDLILVKGWPTRRGSRTIDADQPWDVDGPPVARLREAGAVLIGKTTTPEFGWKGVTDSPLTGTTVNPWDTARTPGGSSGGAAAAAALGMGTLHLATDGGGSIRMPAGFCGLFGHKPTFGAVPVHPHSPAGTLWHQGPIARTVDDACLMLDIISQPDARDWQAVPLARPVAPNTSDDSSLEGLRVAYSRSLGYARVDPQVTAQVDAAVHWFADRGAIVVEEDPGFEDPIDVMVTLWTVALALATDGLSPAQRELVDPPILELAERGKSVSALAYRRAEQSRDALGRHMRAFHERYDLLMTPQLPLTAFEVGHEVPLGSGMTRWWEWSPFTYPFNLTQQPAAALPCGFASNGMPAAVQIVARKFDDERILRTCRAYERANPFVMPTHVNARSHEAGPGATALHV